MLLSAKKICKMPDHWSQEFVMNYNYNVAFCYLSKQVSSIQIRYLKACDVMPDIQILYVKDKYVIDSNAQYCDKNINFVDTVFD